MTDVQIENIKNLLKTHYGSTKVVVDNDLMFVYGSDANSVYTAMIIEHGHDHHVIYEKKNEDLKEVVLRIVKKNQKNVDKESNL